MAKAPSFGDESDSGISTLLAYMLSQDKGKGLQQQLPNAIATEGTDAATGAKFVDPVASGKVEAEKTMGQRTVETAPSRSIMRGTLVKAKQLTDTVPPAPKGIQKFIKGSQTAIKGETGEIPQIKEFHNMVDSALTSFARTMYAEKGNVANWDIARVKKSFSDIVWDTEDQRALGWNRAVDTYNDVIGAYKGLQGETIDKRELLSPKEIGRARFLSGANVYDDLSDEEMEGVFDGDVETIPKPFLEKAVAEYEKRGLHQKGQMQ